MGASTNAFAEGKAAKCSTIEPFAKALKKARASGPSFAGKKGVEWVIISVWTRRGDSARTNLIARPRGFPFGSVSGNSGRPVELEKRAKMGVLRWKCGADDRADAPGVGVNDPSRRMPFACANFLLD